MIYDPLAYKCAECGMIEAPRTGNGCRHCQTVAQVAELTRKLTQARQRMESEIAARDQMVVRLCAAQSRAESLQERLDEIAERRRLARERRKAREAIKGEQVSTELHQLPDDENGRRWSVTLPMSIPEWIYRLAEKHGLAKDGTIIAPNGPHPFYDELEEGET